MGFNPSQPRATSGPHGGEWVKAGSSTSKPQDLTGSRGQTMRPTDKKPDARHLSPLLDRADESLPPEAQKAITDFVAHGPKGREIDDEMRLPLMNQSLLEDAYSSSPSAAGRRVREQIDTAFAPVRETLRREFGDSVRLYRHQTPLRGTESTRNVLSWTTDPKVAESFAKVSGVKQISDSEVHATADQMARAGRASYGSYRFEKSTSYPGSVDVFREDSGGREFVAGIGDGVQSHASAVREFMQNQQEDRREYATADARKRSNIQMQDVPLDRVIWATNRANQMEFIVRNNV